MPFKVSINKDKHLLYVQAVGRLLSQDIDSYYEELSQNDDITTCHKGLVDLTDHTMRLAKVSLTSVRNMGWQFKTKPLMPPGSKMAFVVDSRLVYGFVRVFMARRGEDLIIEPFTNMSEALQWLEIHKSDIPN